MSQSLRCFVDFFSVTMRDADILSLFISQSSCHRERGKMETGGTSDWFQQLSFAGKLQKTKIYIFCKKFNALTKVNKIQKHSLVSEPHSYLSVLDQFANAVYKVELCLFKKTQFSLIVCSEIWINWLKCSLFGKQLQLIVFSQQLLLKCFRLF